MNNKIHTYMILCMFRYIYNRSENSCKCVSNPDASDVNEFFFIVNRLQNLQLELTLYQSKVKYIQLSLEKKKLHSAMKCNDGRNSVERKKHRK
jgi:hypothetical protein